jgi:hypothetical protein
METAPDLTFDMLFTTIGLGPLVALSSEESSDGLKRQEH